MIIFILSTCEKEEREESDEEEEVRFLEEKDDILRKRSGGRIWELGISENEVAC